MRTSNVKRDTVLIVDDAIDSIRMLNDVLEAAGMTVLVALEGSQALNIAQSITPDIILLDAMMPNMDGFETCRQLKELPDLIDVPIIFMTGLSDTEHVVMGLSAGGVDYVAKPINPAELVARMQVHLANARMTRSVRTALDRSGQALFATDYQGAVLWATDLYHKRLRQAGFNNQEYVQALTISLSAWISNKPEPGYTLPLEHGAGLLHVELLARIGADEFLMRLNQADKPAEVTQKLREQFEVTEREADVLLWIANGKTNREIGMILDMSPRTVNKHLEQIFRKLGVENRTAAAALAIRCLVQP